MSSSSATTTTTTSSDRTPSSPSTPAATISASTTTNSSTSPPRSSSKRGPALTISVQALHKPAKPKAKDIIMASRALQQQQQQQQIQMQDYSRAQDIARDIMDDQDEHDHRQGGRGQGGSGTSVSGYGNGYEQEEDLTLDEHGAHHYQHHSQPRQQQQQAQQGQGQGQGQMRLHYVDEDGQDDGHHHHHHHGDDDGDDHDEEDLDEDSGSFSDSLSSSPSIPDDDIDFTLVYALHTFLATVDGQASVVKGDKLLLLDDSNSYWWLVRVLKTQAVGYIPAENIETPWERLARLNKHLNVDVSLAREPSLSTRWELIRRSPDGSQLTTATQQDVLSGPRSTVAQTRFQTRIPPSQQPHPHMSQHPSAKGVIASPSHKDHPRNISPPPSRLMMMKDAEAGEFGQERSHSSKAKTVGFTAPTYYEHSANGDSEAYDDDEGDETGSGDEEYGEEDDEMSQEGDHGQQQQQQQQRHHRRRRRNRGDDEGELMGDQVFEDHDEDDEDDEETSEFSDDHHDQSRLHSVQAPMVATKGGAAAREAHNVHQAVHHLESHGHIGEIGTIENAGSSNVSALEEKTPTAKKRYSASDLGNIEPGMNLYQLRSPDGSLNQDTLASTNVGNLSPLVAPTRDSTRTSTPNSSLAPLEGAPAETDLFSSLRRPSAATSTSSGLETGSIRGRAVNLDVFEPDAPTKKVSATPPIVRDPNFDINDPFGDLQKPRGISNASVMQSTIPATTRSHATVETDGKRNGAGGGTPSNGVHISPVRVRGVEVVNVNDPRYDRLIGPAKRLHQENAQRANSLSNNKDLMEYSPRPQSPNDGFVRKGSLGRDGDVSMTSMETTSSYAPSGAGPHSEENARATTPNSLTSENGAGGKGKVKRSGSTGSGGRDSVDGGANEESAGGKKRKSGGILGLFRKKDKKKKNSSLGSLNASDEGHGMSNSGGARSSEESNRIASPVPAGVGTGAGAGSSGSRNRDQSRRESQTVDTLFSTDAALRQQQLEAKQAMYHQYGVQRAPGDVSNTVTPRAGPGSVALTPQGSQQSISATPVRMRPGSLLGSPSIPGFDVPLLSVLRVFAGDHIDSEATFKTVLLNRATTTHDLVKQGMQRFRLTGDAEIDEYYLTVRELGGEERVIGEQVRPLAVFEAMSEAAEQGFIVPSVKRSSIGSITSIQSNLSLNPAITRLGMNDWSDDSAVKFYLNRRRPRTRDASLHGTLAKLEALTTGSPMDKDGTSPTRLLSPSSNYAEGSAGLLNVDLVASASPSFRFAARIIIHPQDLPETVVFDPQSNAIIPRSVLSDRRNIGLGVEPISPDERERIVFFPRNANVSEVIEAGLDRFGIVDGVVDGGDEVEDRVSKRRSVSRVKYALAVEKDGHETLLHSSSKLIDAYPTPPLLRSYDRTSKEFRRRSVDATLILGSEQDLQPTDPVFVLRRAAYRGPASRGVGPIPATIDELEERQQKRAFAEHQIASEPRAPSSSGHSSTSSSTQPARSLLSARQNDEQGVDIAIPQQGTIRSVRANGGRVRYSFIGPNGQSTDISDLVDREFAPAAAAATTQSGSLHPGLGDRSISQASRSTNHTTTDTESFHTAKESDSIYSSGNASSTTLNAIQAAGSGDEESHALRALTSTDIRIDTSVASPVSSPTLRSPTFNLRPLGAASALRQAATAGQSPRVASPLGTQETEDVLQGAFGSRRAMSPAFNESLQERLDRVLAKVKEDKLRGRISPALRPPSWASEHQRGVSGSSTPTVRAVSPPRLAGSNGRLSPGGRPGGSPSIDQVVSFGSSTSRAPSSSTVRNNATSATPTPTPGPRSATSTTTAQNGALYYHDDFGLEKMLTIVNDGSRSGTKPRSSSLKRPQGHEALFGPSLRDLDLSDETKTMYEPQTRRLEELESRLDALLLRLRVPNPESRLKTPSPNPAQPSSRQHPSLATLS